MGTSELGDSGETFSGPVRPRLRSAVALLPKPLSLSSCCLCHMMPRSHKVMKTIGRLKVGVPGWASKRVSGGTVLALLFPGRVTLGDFRPVS